MTYQYLPKSNLELVLDIVALHGNDVTAVEIQQAVLKMVEHSPLSTNEILNIIKCNLASGKVDRELEAYLRR